MEAHLYDIFEYIQSDDSPDAYLYNRFTGETILDATDYLHAKRSQSFWRPIDSDEGNLRKSIPTVTLTPEGYASRVDYRFFYKWKDPEDAAKHIITVLRGYIARKKLRTLYRERYYTKYSEDSGFLYFVDSITLETSWNKPLLAFPDDILPQKPLEVVVAKETVALDTVNKEELFSYKSHLAGPFRKRFGAGQKSTVRAVHSAFLVENPRRDVAVRGPGDIDVNTHGVGSSVIWMDDTLTKDVFMDDYAVVRSAFAENGGDNWRAVLRVMEQYPGRVFIHIYAMRCFAKGNIPIDPLSGMLSLDGKDALAAIEKVLQNEDKSHRYTHIYFALEALYNLCSVRAGRAEFFSTVHIVAVGMLREKAIQNYFKYKLNILHQYLNNIPTEEIIMPVVLEDTPVSVVVPSPRACDIAALVITVLDTLSRDKNSQELIAEYSVMHVLRAMEVCAEDPSVVLSGLKLLYTMCYRNAMGYEVLLAIELLKKVIQNAKDLFAGDASICIQLQRVEESLKPDGWRGQLET